MASLGQRSGELQTVMGVPLQPDERVIYFSRPRYTGLKVLLWVAGILTLVVLIGIVFIVMALLIDSRLVRAQVLTTRRVIEISGKGVPTILALSDVTHVRAARQQSAESSTESIAELALNRVVLTAAIERANREAALHELTDPSYWKDSIGIELVAENQRMQLGGPLSVRLELGPLLARAVTERGSAEAAPSVPFES